MRTCLRKISAIRDHEVRHAGLRHNFANSGTWQDQHFFAGEPVGDCSCRISEKRQLSLQFVPVWWGLWLRQRRDRRCPSCNARMKSVCGGVENRTSTLMAPTEQAQSVREICCQILPASLANWCVKTKDYEQIPHPETRDPYSGGNLITR